MTEELKVGRRVKIIGYQDGMPFNGEIGRVIISQSHCRDKNGYDYAIEFDENQSFEYGMLHSCYFNGRHFSPKSNGFWFKLSDVKIISAVEDTFDQDGEE